jgi:predicted nuclease of predicted toxin-antitoxin system
MISIVIDEDMPRSLAGVLRERGFGAKDIRDCGLRGAEDDEVMRFAQNNRAVVVTGDLDFSNILRFPIGSHCGIVVARFPTELSTETTNRELVKRLQELTEDDLNGNLVIIEPGKTRIRRRNISDP